MDLNEIMRIQALFDKSHSASRPFYVEINARNLNELDHLVVCLIGEIGEFANILKKVTRGDFSYGDARSALEEELVDAFIYLLKIGHQAEFDLEQGYFKKLKKNFERFKKWEIQDEQVSFPFVEESTLLTCNNDSPVHLALIKWVWDTDPNAAVLAVRAAAVRLDADLPCLFESVLSQGFELPSDERKRTELALYTALELLVGAMSPALVRTEVGENFKKKLFEIGVALGLEKRDMVRREASADHLRRWFSEILPTE